LQMLVFAGVLGCFERWLVLPTTLAAKSAIPDNKNYQELSLLGSLLGADNTPHDRKRCTFSHQSCLFGFVLPKKALGNWIF